MKKQIALILALLALGCFSGCGEHVEKEQTFPQEVTELETSKSEAPRQQNIALTDVPYEGETLYGFPVVRFDVYEQREADLDQCGQAETVALLQVYDEYDQSSIALRVVKGDEVYDTPYLYTWDSTLWVEDLNGDGQMEIYTSGDVMSSDYVTYGWKLTDEGLRSLSSDAKGMLTNGRISEIKDGVVFIAEYQYVLGTWLASRAYISSDVRGIEPQHSTVWTMADTENAFYLRVIEPLPVTVDGTMVLLPVGSELTLTAFDGENTVWFKTADGLEGLLRVHHGCTGGH